jgi:uncharacterized membrane protein YhaH (DUF805 family)
VRGNVIGFDRDTNIGAISGHDGNRYDFVTLDWRGQHPPRHGDIVDFQAVEQRATDIFLIEPVYNPPSLADFYFSPSGRISRSQYWLKFVLPYFVISFVLQTVGAIAGADSALNSVVSIILGLFGLIVLWPSIAILVKRMHDRNKSAWYLLAQFVPSILFMIMLCVWLGPTVIAIVTAGADDATPTPSMNFAGVTTVVLGMILFGIASWFFVEFGCMRGTIGPNRFGPDPVR